MDNGVALETVTGTGSRGRVSPGDVLRAARTGVPAAQLTVVMEVDLTPVVMLTDRVRDDLERRTGVRLSLTVFCAKAALESLRSHPLLGAGQDLGVAVDTAGGRVVPVIRNAGDLNLLALAREIAEASRRAVTQAPSPDDLAGGAFTLTDAGSLGALFETTPLSPPQTGALAFGTVVERPAAIRTEDGSYAIAIRSMAHLALSYDQRVVSGAYAAQFLAAVKTRLQAGDFAADLR